MTYLYFFKYLRTLKFYTIATLKNRYSIPKNRCNPATAHLGRRTSAETQHSNVSICTCIYLHNTLSRARSRAGEISVNYAESRGWLSRGICHSGVGAALNINNPPPRARDELRETRRFSLSLLLDFIILTRIAREERERKRGRY